MKRMKGIYAIGVIAGCLLAGAAGAQTASQPAKSGAAAAPSAPNPLGQKYDTKLPIEISSDKLEVHQHENVAIFTGNVIAVQGKIRLTADKMNVHYRQKSGQPAQTPQPVPGGNHVTTAVPAAQPTPGGAPAASAPGSPADSMGAISLIEVEGNVFMATPEESAKGDRGNYQVDEKLLHLYGDNVILTRDKNILRGTELLYNLETGQSVLTSHGSNVGPNGGRVHGVGVQGSSDNPNGGRVRGVFVPNQDNSKNGKSAKAKKPATASSSTAVPASPTAPAASAPATIPASGNAAAVKTTP